MSSASFIVYSFSGFLLGVVVEVSESGVGCGAKAGSGCGAEAGSGCGAEAQSGCGADSGSGA